MNNRHGRSRGTALSATIGEMSLMAMLPCNFPIKKCSKENGFSLIELIIVMVITGVVLSFVLPNFRAFNPLSPADNVLGKTVQLIDRLKIQAMTEYRDYVMHVDLAQGLIWISHDTMDEDQTDDAKNSGIRFSGDTILLGVEYPQPLPHDTDQFLIRFYKKGYSDMALIHLKNDDEDVTLVIEPFLANAELEKRIVSYDRCI